MKILSLGAGVQSTTLLLMSLKGDLESLDHVIFCDTGWEPKEVYAHLERLKEECAKHGLPLHVVGGSNIKDDALVSQVRGKAEDGERWASMPYFTKGPDGSRGMIRRQCTTEYKLKPIERKTRELMGLKKGQRAGPEWMENPLEQWIGISVDEYQRARLSRKSYITNVYPLIDMKFTRHMCVNWLLKHGWKGVPKSSCLGCPFRSDPSWRGLKTENPDEWDEVVEFDKAVRKCVGMRGEVYLHSSRKPLDEVDLENDVDRGQGLLFGNTDCTGPCGT